ncbi:hypothetical protein Tco_0820640 [Tanacetum coccineum]|uniref:Retrovirus-related Pol polyprotein from transposon TNT 1-94-like beta-barrel domain-containing protein n=1 Tax=Tanacetum coccineum TaxID=301880 RepID=A0ABQ5AAW0_9ASTR
MDEIVKSENIDVITFVTPSNVKKVESNHESADVKNNGDAVKPKTVRKNSFRPPVIEDWNSDDDSEVEFIPNVKDKTIRPSTEKIKFVKFARETVEKVIRPVWNNSSRVNHKNFANKMTHPHPNRRFVPQAVLTRSGKINTVGASVNTAVRPVNTVGSKTTVNHPRPISNAYKKGYSQVTKPFNKYSANKNSIFNKKVNIVRVKDTTARDRAVVSENKGKGANAVKASACWGNPQQKEYKEKGVIDSGCSRHMTGNKCYLTKYEDYDGGFVSFGDGKGRISGKVSKAMRVFIKRTRIVEETLNIRFLENTPNVIGNGPNWLFDVDSLTISMNYVPVVAGNQTNGIAGTRDNIVTGQAEKKTEPKQEYILIPICTTNPLISQDPKVSEEDAEEKPTEMDTVHPNSTNSINTVSTPVSAAGPSFTNDDPSSPVNAAEASNAFEEHLFERFSPFKNAFTLPPVSNVTPMDDTGIFGNAYDHEDVGADADLNNLGTTMNVSPIPTTRIDKDHPKD